MNDRYLQLEDSAWQIFNQDPAPNGAQLLMRLRYWPSFDEREIIEIWRMGSVQGTGRYWGRFFLWDWPKDQDTLENWESRATVKERLWARYRPVVWTATVQISTGRLNEIAVDAILRDLSPMLSFVAKRSYPTMIDGTTVHLQVGPTSPSGEVYWHDENHPYTDSFTAKVRNLGRTLETRSG